MPIDWTTVRQEFARYGDPFPFSMRVTCAPRKRNGREAPRFTKVGAIKRVESLGDVERLLARNFTELRGFTASHGMLTRRTTGLFGYGTLAKTGEDVEIRIWV